MKRRVGVVLSLLLLSLLGGCAFTDATLGVRYTDQLASRGPLATIPPRQLEIGPLEDRRPETTRIGYKRNGFNMKTADIRTEKPVPEIVRDALATELAKNGHSVAKSGSTVRLSGDITEFWLDISIGFFTIDFVGTTSLALKVQDASSGAVILERAYRGYHKETAAGGLEGTWEHVMNTALQQMMRDVGTDLRLVEALKGAGP